MVSRRGFLKSTVLLGVGLALPNAVSKAQPVDSPPQPPTDPNSIIKPAYSTPSLDPVSIPKFIVEMVRPHAMPGKTEITDLDGKPVDYYEIGVRQFRQQILPPPSPTSPTLFPMTTVWGYGPAGNNEGDLSGFNYPSFTIEATVDKPVRVRWVNQLFKTIAGKKYYLPHLLPVDPTLHWANPAGPVDVVPEFAATPGAYLGPVPMVPHVHGAHVTAESDGYTSAWWLPDADDIPTTFSRHGSWYDRNKAKFHAMHGSGPNADWTDNSAVFQYRNDQLAGTIWYHDHTLGMTRLNVYAGPAGFYLLRGGTDGKPVEGILPEGAYEFPVAIQDRSFNLDLANNEAPLFYPGSRAYFDGFSGPFIPSSDIPPIWNPEFFGNTIVVNGNTWPKSTVEQRRYRIRFLNGCNARTLILKLVTDSAAVRPAAASLPFWVIGTEGGFLPVAAVSVPQLTMMPAERYDVIIDFSAVPVGTSIYLINEGPDYPYQGGAPVAADPLTTGVVMRFDVITRTGGADPSSDPRSLVNWYCRPSWLCRQLTSPARSL